MRKVLLMFLIAICLMACGAVGVSAATISGVAPTIQSIIPGIDAILNAEIAAAFNSAIDSANEELAKYHDQKELAKGFGNASVFSSQAGTFQGYQNYSKFAITTGVMLGVQAPSTDPNFYDNIEDEIEASGDLYAGVSAGVSLINIGFNAKSIRPGLYLNFMFGSYSVEPDDELSISTSLIGVGANYSLVKPKPGSFLFKWRGLSVGTGLFYHKSEVSLSMDLDEFSEDFTVTEFGYPTVTGTVSFDPSIYLALNSKTMTIPVDITTSVQLLHLFNLTLGTGIDFNMGKTDIIITANGVSDVDSIQVNGINAPGAVEVTQGVVVVDGSTKGISPSFARLRTMSGLGFNFGPVKFDIPVRYYFGAGISFGVTAGVIF